MYLLYDLLLALALLISAPYWLIRLVGQGKYREGICQRLGKVPPHVRALASPGQAAHLGPRGLGGRNSGHCRPGGADARALRRLHYCHLQHHRTGHALASARFGAENVFYFPLDLSFACGRYLRLLRPRLVVLAETEFWPNFLRAARRRGARVAVVNARISDRSFPRYRRFSSLLRRVLGNVDLFLAQSEEGCRSG